MAEFKFALNLLKTTTGNACVSPLNIAHALGMVMLGAESETRDEVARGVGFNAASDAHNALSASINALTANDIASVAARLFVQRGFQLKVCLFHSPLTLFFQGSIPNRCREKVRGTGRKD